MKTIDPHLTDVVCWTRMHAESGQDIMSIIARKELERRAGGGLFFWGVGNPPSRCINRFAARGDEIDVVFSLMKTRPRIRDIAPTGILRWRTYFDIHGLEHPIPEHALVTSRMEIASGKKRVHYALMCSSEDELRFDDYGSFDPSAYRNVGDGGGPVSSSQVTALVVRSCGESQESSYRINLRAKLTGDYWVRLGRPYILDESDREALVTASARAREMDSEEWIGLISDFNAPSAIEEQQFLF